jgi:ABC-type phosphate/phosphonate transport system permease subunit
MKARSWVRRTLIVLLLLALLISLRQVGLLDPVRLSRGIRNIGIFVGGLFPPDPAVLPTVAGAMVETVQIAFLGTGLGFLLALPLAIAANRALFGSPIAGAATLLLALVRTVPSLLWGIIFVVAVGLGPAAGALGIAAYSLGYLGKLLSDTFEGVDPERSTVSAAADCSWPGTHCCRRRPTRSWRSSFSCSNTTCAPPPSWASWGPGASASTCSATSRCCGTTR